MASNDNVLLIKEKRDPSPKKKSQPIVPHYPKSDKKWKFTGDYVQRKVYKYREGYEANGTKVEYQTDWQHQHQLEGDGLLPLIYDHMWKSDKTKEHNLKCAWIPDTVVFEHNFPRAWYTYEAKTSEIRKLPGKQLDARSIYGYFSEELQGCPIVAQFYYKTYNVPATKVKNSSDSPSRSARGASSSGTRRGAGSATARSEGGGGSEWSKKKGTEEEPEDIATAVEYFTATTLYEFLHNRQAKPDGVLQKFLVPKGKPSSRQNFQLQAVYSPRLTRVYKRTNRYRLSDRSVPLAQRSATFDGPPHLSTESLVAHSTQERIEDVCKAIVQHFSKTEGKPVVRAIIYFKLDDKDRLWVLWASSLRFGGDKYNPVYLRVPMHLDLRVETAARRLAAAKKASGDLTDDKVEDYTLLDRDIQLYDMTGDWLFARAHCAGKDAHKNNGQFLQSQEEGEEYGEEKPEEGEKKRKTQESPPMNNENESSQNPASSGTLTPRRKASASQHHRCSALLEQPTYISPRAPFLPTMSPRKLMDPESERHPLHELYEKMLNDEHQRKDQSKAISGHGRRFTMRFARQVPVPPKKPKHLSQLEKLKGDVRAAADDMVYVAYSNTLEVPGERAPLAPAALKLELAPIIRIALSLDDVEVLVKVMHLTAIPESDGLLYTIPASDIARARRTDRPGYQIADDIKAFLEEVFERDGDAIAVRWKNWEDSRDSLSTE